MAGIIQQRMIESATAADLYPARHELLTAEAGALERKARRYRLWLMLCGSLAVVLLVLALRGAIPGWPITVPVLAGALAILLQLRTRREQDRLGRLLSLYGAGLARLDGSRTQTGHTGEEFRAATHLYDRDLAILGPDSLFGMLATVRTGVGQRGLANDLLRPHTREATLARQQAVGELAPRQELREQVHLLGISQFQQVPAAFFDAWLDAPPPVFSSAFRAVLVALTTALFGLLLAGLSRRLPWATVTLNLAAVLSAQALVALYLRPRVLPILNGAAKLSNQTQMFRDGLALLQAAAFASPKLHALQAESRQPAGAIPLLNQLHAQLVVVEQRATQWFLLASLLLNAGTHAALSIAAWKRQHAAAMRQWLATWAEFESLLALATYAFEHPGYAYPEILAGGQAVFEATALAHPLLGHKAVPNDVALRAKGGEEQTVQAGEAPAAGLYVISGSNMAGKSTLLRAIGLNAVLGGAGAPVRATSARMTPLALGASLALTDSLAEGKSKFLAEVERLHAILQLAEQPTPVLFLIDEIFSGTNSLDRRVAAEAVARALVERGAIGALSTHDLTLTEMAGNPALGARNLHMASSDPADPLAFDYRLKTGVNPASNALAILRLIGIWLAP